MNLREEDTTHVWSDSDTAQTAIGQLYTLFTPIQLCNYTAAIANGGTLKTPYLIKSIVNGSGNIVFDNTAKAESGTDLGISAYVMNAVKDGMKAMVAESGTAQTAFSKLPYGFVAAKTGTPETGLEAFGESSHGLLVCYAPADDPEIAVAIVLEHGVYGSNALPAAGRILEAYFGDRYTR
jgi:penicillin-binding protein 2